MGKMIGGVPPIVCHQRNAPGTEIMNKCHTLGGIVETYIAGEHQIVVNKRWAMADLHIGILLAVMVKYIARDTRALGLPIQPNPLAAVVNKIVLYQHVNGSVELNSRR